MPMMCPRCAGEGKVKTSDEETAAQRAAREKYQRRASMVATAILATPLITIAGVGMARLLSWMTGAPMLEAETKRDVYGQVVRGAETVLSTLATATTISAAILGLAATIAAALYATEHWNK